MKPPANLYWHMRREQAVRTTSPFIISADEGALVSDVEARTIRSLLVLSHVPSSIATITSPEAVAGREGAEADEDKEEDEEEE
jgi:hypothetical protein